MDRNEKNGYVVGTLSIKRVWLIVRQTRKDGEREVLTVGEEKSTYYLL